MDADVSICSKPGGSRRTLSLIAAGGAVWSLLAVLLVGSAGSHAVAAPDNARPAQTSAAAESSNRSTARTPSSSSTSASSSSSRPASSHPGTAREEQLAAKIAELDKILAERQALEDNLRTEKLAQSEALAQMNNTKKLIRLEVEDFFAQSSNSERLDSLLGEYKRDADAHASAIERVAAIERDLAGQQLKFAQAERDVERLRAQLAAEIRERNSRKVQSVARKLDKVLEFEESISFRCSPNKSLAACLAEQQQDGRIGQWVQQHYRRALEGDLAGEIERLDINPTWYRYRTKVDYSQASMSLDGTVTAQMAVKATVLAKKMMPCALLDVPYELCDVRTFSLTVRSNKYDDRVSINDESYGSTPVSLELDSGVYRIEVSAGGVTQKRTLSLNGDQVVNFKF